MPADLSKLKNFQFRDLHQNLFMGTTSDRYAGWIGQIYSDDRYAGRITRRTKKVGGKAFVEEILPVESVEEYFQHFRVLELDFTFYQLLMDKEGKPTQNFHILRNYRQHLKKDDKLILSNWTWLPSLSRQFALSGRRVFNVDRECIIRLMTPLGMRYEDAYARAHPFNALKEGMLNHQMVKETVKLIQEGADQGQDQCHHKQPLRRECTDHSTVYCKTVFGDKLRSD